MARPPNLESANRARIQFAFNGALDTIVGVVFQYLLKHPYMTAREGKRKGVDAIVTFWKPFAYREQGQVSPAELQTIAQESIEGLTQQIELIRSTFGLAAAASGSAAVSLEVREAVKAAIRELVAAGELTPTAPVPSPRSAEPDGMTFDAEALLGSLLESSQAA